MWNLSKKDSRKVGRSEATPIEPVMVDAKSDSEFTLIISPSFFNCKVMKREREIVVSYVRAAKIASI